jgi:3',5'-nucleoside bisphosphate phosphatase
VRIDLHTHSHRSDGTDSPGELIGRAAAGGIDVVALTDHDTAVGWQDARDAALELGLGFVPGMEVSCSRDGASVHLLAYLLDPEFPPLAAELWRVLDGRASRLPRIIERLRAVGVDISEADVHAVAGSAQAMGRPHVADALVAKGVVADRQQAFEELLSKGKPGHVARDSADLVDMIGLVAAAGGVSVIAHPWGRHSRTALDADTLAELRGAGLGGIEVDHQDHDADARARLREIAGRLGLMVTGSSDFHGEGKPDCPLGANTTDPEQFERLLAAASAASSASGRETPAPLLP